MTKPIPGREAQRHVDQQGRVHTHGSTHRMITWFGDDGYLYVTVKPHVWEHMTDEAWLRAARRRARSEARTQGIDWARAGYLAEHSRVPDWAIPEHSYSKTFRSIDPVPVKEHSLAA